jgi:hypothetical protein
MKSLLIALIVVLILLGAAWTVKMSVEKQKEITSIDSFEECVAAGNPVMESYPPRCSAADMTFTQDIGNELELADLIRIDSPRPNTTVVSPLQISGEARGTWYFEASFPAKLLDADGSVIAEHYAQAQDDWMTEDFVPFKSTLEFATPETETGTLVLEKDNPSGLPEHANALRVPVQFSQTAQTISIEVYFGNDALEDDETSCTEVFSVKRIVSKTTAIARAALEELLKGPTQFEEGEGYRSSLPQNAGVKINSLTIENGVARVDFNGALDEGVAGSCRVSAIRAQIEETLKQFPTIQEVVISVEGNIEEALQP